MGPAMHLASVSTSVLPLFAARLAAFSVNYTLPAG